MFPGLRPGPRAGLAFAFGALGAVNGGMHLGHVTKHGAAGSDVTGVLAAAAAGVLLGLAAVIPWRHRGEGAATARRRWVRRAVAVPVGLLGLFVVLGPMGMGVGAAHKWREPIGAPPAGVYEDVTFRASDGLELAGWYAPSRNGAAVLVLHGGSSDRRGAAAHAQMLARHGYGVLLYDARGRGESDGSENNYGWDWVKDVDGALAFLAAREDVEPGRIGAVGLSTGADALIQAAARRPAIAALVTDGAAAGSFADWHHLRGIELGAAPGWVMFSTLRVVSGDAPGPPLDEAMARIESPTLLISAGRDVEREFNARYAAASHGRAEHWNLPAATHTRAIRSDRTAYERRVVRFLDSALR